MSASDDSHIGRVIDGYRIESVIRRGGMGVVYQAHQLKLDRPVAIKLIHKAFAADASFRERFKRESMLAAKIRHPHVVTVHDAADCDGELYIAMDLVEGTDLAQVIGGSGPIEPARATDLVMQVAGALDALHRGQLVHRDVKPANILVGELDERDYVYLTDFGVAKHIPSEIGLTLPGVMPGTPDYMAPEQVQGHTIDARADVYALGCVLYTALTGQVPYPRDNDAARYMAHIGAAPPSLAAVVEGLPGELDRVVARALAKDPADRYPSAGDLGRAAVAALASRKPDEPERTVAQGEAKPTVVAAAPTQAGSHDRLPGAEAVASDGTRTPADQPLRIAAAPVAAAGGGAPPPSGTSSGSTADGSGDSTSSRRRKVALILLLLACLAALAVAITATRPDDGEHEPVADVLVLIDLSKSMSASLGDPDMPGYTRIEAVRDFAIPRIGFLDQAGDRVGVWLITTSSRRLPPRCRARRPCELQPLTTATLDVRTRVQEAITPTDQTSPGWGPTTAARPCTRASERACRRCSVTGHPTEP